MWSTLGLFYVGDILDVDNDGVNELLVTNRSAGQLELYSYNGVGFEVEAIVRDCAPVPAYFFSTAGDLDGDGTPEILFQCYRSENLIIQEYDNGSYPIVGSVPAPLGFDGSAMFVDDMETGDVNGDGLADAVFCGNSGQAHVLTYDTDVQDYVLEFSSPPPVDEHSFSQTCSVGDVTNDGQADILVVTVEGAKVYSYDGNAYYEVWVGPPLTWHPPIAGSFIGDSDSDGFIEFIYIDHAGDAVLLFEGDEVGASSFTNTVMFGPIMYSGTVLIGDLDSPIFSDSFESGDTSAWSAAVP